MLLLGNNPEINQINFIGLTYEYIGVSFCNAQKRAQGRLQIPLKLIDVDFSIIKGYVFRSSPYLAFSFLMKLLIVTWNNKCVQRFKKPEYLYILNP